jgi:glyoxylase-like metal-dependent hydrolase (beta-lactamase superfamily II)
MQNSHEFRQCRSDKYIMDSSKCVYEDFLQIRCAGVTFYVLRDSKGLYLIDCGFIGGRQALLSALKKQGWYGERIIGIIVTHGHLDHILNVGRIAEETGAWIAAPRLDALHYQGEAIYRGLASVTGGLESMARPLFGFRKFVPTRLLDDGDRLDIWDGLSVVHLPGHTAGHSGFYCERRNLLFSADLFASYRFCSHLPPAIFNYDGTQIPRSVAKALALDLLGVLPNHGDDSSPAVHLQRLREIKSKIGS